MIFVYAIRSNSKNIIYVGMTNDLKRRIKEHNSGKNISTKAYRPFGLIYFEKLKSRVEARIRESI